jgi:hypothetical protein
LLEVIGNSFSPLGCSLGNCDGDCEGDVLGLELGSILDGAAVVLGSELGCEVDGCELGDVDGLPLGLVLGELVGLELGDLLGLALGELLGVLEGESLGDDEGEAVGAPCPESSPDVGRAVGSGVPGISENGACAGVGIAPSPSVISCTATTSSTFGNSPMALSSNTALRNATSNALSVGAPVLISKVGQ